MFEEKESIVKELIIRTANPDSIEIKESAKGELYFSFKIYGDSKNVDELIDRASKLKEAIEKKILRRGV